MRKALSALLLTCFVLPTLSISPVLGRATQRITASGPYECTVMEWTKPFYWLGKTVQGYGLSTGTHTIIWEGTIEGTAVYDLFSMTKILSDEPLTLGDNYIFLRGTFTGTVDGKTGTMHMYIEAKGSFQTWQVQFQWVIYGGTGGLASIHGKGTGSGIMGGTGTYSGEIYFGPP